MRNRQCWVLKSTGTRPRYKPHYIIVDALPDVTILGHKVDVVDSFVYLGSSIDASGGNDSDIRRRIELARTCMKSLDRGIWRSSISLVTKLRLYNVYILPVLFYDSDTWNVSCDAAHCLNRRTALNDYMTVSVNSSC